MKNPNIKKTSKDVVELLQMAATIKFHTFGGHYCWNYCPMCEQYEVVDDDVDKVVDAFATFEQMREKYPDAPEDDGIIV